MDKKGIVHSMEIVREIKELRNQIVHEYILEDIAELFGEICRLCPDLFKMVDKVVEYIRMRIER